jgi:hypothetical protein
LTYLQKQIQDSQMLFKPRPSPASLFFYSEYHSSTSNALLRPQRTHSPLMMMTTSIPVLPLLLGWMLLRMLLCLIIK